jgi:hypothetical protein
MTRFADDLSAELSVLVRARVPLQGIRLTVRERIVERLGRGPLGAREVSEAVEAAVRAAGRLAASGDAADDLVDTVCRAAFEAVRGQGGHSARWLTHATSAAEAALDGLAQERGHEPTWPWLRRRLGPW